MSLQQKKVVFKEFISTYFDLLEFMNKHSNNNLTFKKFYYKNYLLKKTNIKLFIVKWYQNITLNYYKPIIDGNLDFFLEKDYQTELNNHKELNNDYNIGDFISYFKNIYSNIENKLITNVIKKIQSLTQLSFLYFNIDKNNI